MDPTATLLETWDYLIISELMFDITLTCWIFSFSHRRASAPEISQRSIYSIHSLLLNGLLVLGNLWEISTKWQLWYGVEYQAHEKLEYYYQLKIRRAVSKKRSNERINLSFYVMSTLKFSFSKSLEKDSVLVFFPCLNYTLTFSLSEDLYN